MVLDEESRMQTGPHKPYLFILYVRREKKLERGGKGEIEYYSNGFCINERGPSSD